MHDPLFSVDRKLVLITGAAGLIGSELVSTFLTRGAIVIGVDVNLDALSELSASLNSSRFSFYELDVCSPNAIHDLVRHIEQNHGVVDVLINNHQFKPKGFCEAAPENFPDELWHSVIDVNLSGTYLMCKHFGKSMLTAGRGSIINFCSTYGVVSSNPSLYEDNSLGNPLSYTASKGGVLMLTKYLGVHWASKGVRVNAVTPHGVFNDHEPAFDKRFSSMSPMSRMMRAEEVTGAVIYLSSNASSYVTGSNLLVEGGWTAW